MQYPNSEEEAREQIATGRMMEGLLRNQGYNRLFKPFLMMLLEKADAKCHNYKIRSETGKEAVVEYSTIKVIMDFCVDSIENMKSSVEYLDDKGIKY